MKDRRKLKGLHRLAPCSQGRAFLAEHTTLQDAWDACTRWDFYYWYLLRCSVAERRFAEIIVDRARKAAFWHGLEDEVLEQFTCNFVRRVYPQPPELARLSL